MSAPAPSIVKKMKTKPNRKKSIKEIQAEIQKKATVVPEFITMRSETQAVQNVDEKDRNGRISIALGMVVADTKAMQGQEGARKATITLNSDQMKDHMGRICDDALRRRKECPAPSTLTPSKRALNPVSLFPTTFDVKTVPQVPPVPVAMGVPKTKSGKRLQSKPSSQRKVKPSPTRSKAADVSENSKSLGEILSLVAEELQLKALNNVPGKGSGLDEGAMASKGQVTKGQVVKSRVSKRKVPEAKSNVKMNVEQPVNAAKPKTESLPGKSNSIGLVPATPKKELFVTSVDLQGFTNDNISLDLEGRRVIIVAFRPKDNTNHARKVTEIIEIPETVDLDNLKVSRRPDGSLTIEESSSGIDKN